MKTTKTLMLAALTALSLGVGTAMAQESAGGVGDGPWETHELNVLLAGQRAAAAANAHAPQYGSSDRATTANPPAPDLEGADGGGN
jgi:hypothetical protein